MKSLKILIVEDELITATAIQETLENAGHEIIALARNLKEALAAAKRQLPDLALIDITLEGAEEDGITVAKQLMSVHQMPIIYLTAHSESPTVTNAQKTRPAAYLLKPFRQNELAIQVELAYYNYQAQEANTVDPYVADNLYLPVEQGKGYIKIVKKEVLYLSASGAYVEVHTLRDAKPLVFSMNLGYLSQFFNSPDFYRLSRSLVVNLDYIERIEKSQLYLTSREVPVSYPDTQHKELLQKFATVRTS